MSARDRVLAIDVGTQSVRALVFDAAGTPCARAQAPIVPPYHTPEPGWAEQDAEVFWQATASACRALWADPTADAGHIAGVALATQRATTVFAAEEGTPLRPAIPWLNQREAASVPALPGHWHTVFALLGLAGTIGRFQNSAPAHWLAEHAPENARPHRVCRCCPAGLSIA